MSDKEYILGRIVKVLPCAVYMGKVYDQIVTIGLRNGELLHIFDYGMLCKDNYINKKAKIKICVPVANSIEKVKFAESKIYNSNLESGNTGGNCAGKVEKLIKTNVGCHAIINVGGGTVIASAPGLGTKRKNISLDYSDLKVGDYLKIDGARFDLKEIELIEYD